MEPGGDDGAAAAAAPEQPPPAVEQEEMKSENDEKLKNELVLIKAQRLMDKITSSPDNPNPCVLHALASILETQESRSILYSLSKYAHLTVFVLCVCMFWFLENSSWDSIDCSMYKVLLFFVFDFSDGYAVM